MEDLDNIMEAIEDSISFRNEVKEFKATEGDHENDPYGPDVTKTLEIEMPLSMFIFFATQKQREQIADGDFMEMMRVSALRELAQMYIAKQAMKAGISPLWYSSFQIVPVKGESEEYKKELIDRVRNPETCHDAIELRVTLQRMVSGD